VAAIVCVLAAPTLATAFVTTVARAAVLNSPVVGIAATPDGGGYWLVSADGGVFNFGHAGFFGSEGGRPLDAPVVGMAPTPDGRGYWLVSADGGVFNFGDAGFFGSQGGKPLNSPIVAMAVNPDGAGYWLVAADGGVFSFGGAGFYGSEGGRPLDKPIVGMAATRDGAGYWLVASDGGIFSFGDAVFHGSEGSQPLDKPIVGMAATRDGLGYRLVAADGGVFTFGDAHFDGSEAGANLAGPVVGVTGDAVGGGYWLAGQDGGVFSLGSPSFGSMGGAYQPGRSPGWSNPLAPAIVQLAASQLGQTDGNIYGGATEWCAMFASWVYRNAGLPVGVVPAAYEIGTWALSSGGALLPPSATPQVGDAVLFESDGSPLSWPGPGLDFGNVVHVNIVVSVDRDGSFMTIGGDESGPGGYAVREQGPYSAATAPTWWGQTVFAFVQPPV